MAYQIFGLAFMLISWASCKEDIFDLQSVCRKTTTTAATQFSSCEWYFFTFLYYLKLGFRQCYIIFFQRISIILSSAWYPSHSNHTIPSIMQWHSETCCANLQVKFQKLTESTLEQKLSKLLFIYRLTKHSTMGRSSIELILGRQRFDLLKPNILQIVERKQFSRKPTCDDSWFSGRGRSGCKEFLKPRLGPHWLTVHITKLTVPKTVPNW